MNERNERVLLELRRRGVASAGELAGALGLSQPTLSRALSSLPSARLHRIGGGRATCYAWRREIDGSTRWPLYEIDASGDSRRLATLHALSNGSWHVGHEEPWPALTHAMFPRGLHPDWPWFLDDLRPRGFLGRLFARNCAETLAVPADPRDWTAEHTLRALLRFGHDLPGNFVLGAGMLAAARTREPDARAEHPGTDLLLQRARNVLAGQWPGSSAAGEQPKFTLELTGLDGARRHLLVKFSGRTADPTQARWADLLRAEHLANTLLPEHGIPAAQTELREADDRVFLIADRFDRTPAGGRNAMISLHALNAAFGDLNRSWAESAADLRGQGWLDDEGAGRLAVLWEFGRLIGNTDMHDGNLSLFLGTERPLSPTPVYDMTPMALAPRADGTLPEHVPVPPPPPPEQREAYGRAVVVARRFRAALQADGAFTPAFRAAFAALD